MPTLVRDPQPVEIDALIEKRRRLGQDRFDEVWEGDPEGEYQPIERSALIELGPAELTDRLDWPA